MEYIGTLKVKHCLKYGLPLAVMPLVPKSWRRIYLGDMDVTTQISWHDFDVARGFDPDCHETEIGVLLEIEADVTPGTRDYFCNSLGNWHPGDPDEVDFEAYLGDFKVTNYLPGNEIEEIENLAIENYEPPAREYDDY